MQSNPLQKYFRQPKIYLELPTRGKYYPPGMINGDPHKLPVFGMTAMDEIMFKTPDALFSGEATVSVIKSCIPSITNPWLMPQLDIDAVLVALRIATYGQTLETEFKCKSCNEENKFDLDLSKTLDYFLNIEYEDQVHIGPLIVNLRPLTYKEVTEINLQSFELRKRLYQGSIESASEADKNKLLDELYKKIAELNVQGFKKAIASVEAEEGVVSDPQQIQDWIKNSDKEFFDKIREHLEANNKRWNFQTQKVQCAHCETENTVSIGLDNSDFFVKK